MAAAIASRSMARLTALARQWLERFPTLKRWEEADDVVQGAALRLYRALLQVAPTNSKELMYLASALIRRELLDLKRKAMRRHQAGQAPDSSSDALIERQSDSSFEPAKLARWSEFHERVSQLPDELREVFDLVWYQELSHADAAEFLGVSTKTVQRRWREARLRLHDLLDDNEL